MSAFRVNAADLQVIDTLRWQASELPFLGIRLIPASVLASSHSVCLVWTREEVALRTQDSKGESE